MGALLTDCRLLPSAVRGVFWSTTCHPLWTKNVSGPYLRPGRSYSPRMRNASVAAAAAGPQRLDGQQLPFLYGTAWKKERTTELVMLAVREGFRGIDTACQPKHYREDLVGVALERLAREDSIPREALWLQTKFTPMGGQDPNSVPYNPRAPLEAQVEQSIARSLENLRTSRIDSLVLHSPMPTLDQTLRVWRVFERAVEAGTVGQLGISNCYDLDTFQSLYEAAAVKPRVLQNRFYTDSGYDVALREYCARAGVVYQTFWTLTANPHILRSAPMQRAASRLHATPAQVLFRWLIQSGHQPLTGTTSREHMRQDLNVTRLMLTPAEEASIRELFGR
uniref:NADP-dependent oxidoreductase domain-containing protein n=1 Tax=Alexandrium monilatum TaxID=311494 RepID=A0A7S4RR86_9DINO